MRYFLIGFSLSKGSVITLGMIGHSRDGFPSLKDAQDEVRKENEGVEQISIISLTELSETDYETFWSKIN